MKVNYLFLKTFGLTALVLLSFLTHQNSNANNYQDCTLTLGWGNWPPYQSSIEPAHPFGIQIDLVKQIAQTANCSLKFKRNSFQENLEAVQSGSVDFIMDTSITEERKAYGYFSDPYRLEVLALYLKPEFTEQCNKSSFAGLIQNGARIGMNQGNIYGKEVTEAQSKPELNKKLVYAENHKMLYQYFAEGKIDGFFDDPTVLSYKMRRNNQSGKLKLCKVSQYSSTVSFLFSKKTTTPQLVTRFNQALDKVKKTKEYKANWGW